MSIGEVIAALMYDDVMRRSKYKEIIRLKEMLEEHGIPFVIEPMDDGYHITYPDNKNTVCSVIEHMFSYGSRDDLLEIFGLTEDGRDVEGWLTAEDVFNRIFEVANRNNK